MVTAQQYSTVHYAFGDVLGRLVRVHLWLQSIRTVHYATPSAVCSSRAREGTCVYSALKCIPYDIVQYIILRIWRPRLAARASADLPQRRAPRRVPPPRGRALDRLRHII